MRTKSCQVPHFISHSSQPDASWKLISRAFIWFPKSNLLLHGTSLKGSASHARELCVNLLVHKGHLPLSCHPVLSHGGNQCIWLRGTCPQCVPHPGMPHLPCQAYWMGMGGRSGVHSILKGGRKERGSERGWKNEGNN